MLSWLYRHSIRSIKSKLRVSYRNQIEQIDADLFKKIYFAVRNKRIFVIFDEPSFNGVIYANTLFGTLYSPMQTYLANLSIFLKSLNASDVAIAIDQVLKDFSISRENFVHHHLLLFEGSFSMLYSIMVKNRNFSVKISVNNAFLL